MFKSRKGGDDAVPPPSPTESIETMRRRARHRLIGAVVLVLAGVIGFPLLFDTQPRPVAVDLPIEIPDRNKVKPLPPLPPAAPAAAGKVVGPAAAPAAPAVPATPAAPPVAHTEPDKPAVVAKAPEPAFKPVDPAKAAKPETRPAESRPEARPEPAAKAPADGAKALALLEGRTVDAAVESGRFVVQVGAFSDPAKAREARLKVERAGLKTYTHVAETKDGKRIRVRTGPYGTRAEADRAAEKIKGLDLPAAILTL